MCILKISTDHVDHTRTSLVHDGPPGHGADQRGNVGVGPREGAARKADAAHLVPGGVAPANTGAAGARQPGFLNFAPSAAQTSGGA